MKAILKTNIIITQKKPQHNAEASTTTAMISLLQCEGRLYTPFHFLVFVVYFPVWPCVACARSSIALTTEALASLIALETASASFD